MKENDMIEKMADIISSTPTDDDLYYRIGQRILKEVIKPHVDEVKAGYEELLFKFRREMNVKDH
jgi:hypothetical protein